MFQGQSETINERELCFIVGRDRELDIFGELLAQVERERLPVLLHFHGIGGVGKSSILRLCRRYAQQREVKVLFLDGRDVHLSELGMIESLVKQIEIDDEKIVDVNSLCARIKQYAEQQTIVLIIDTFEMMPSMEHWLRERLIPLLPNRMLLLFAGRFPLRGGWILSPAWRERTRQYLILQLSKSACLSYMAMCGMTNEAKMEYIWRQTAGHPLAMSLATSTDRVKRGFDASERLDWFGEVVHWWLQEVHDKEIRSYIESVAILGAFDQERLSFILEEAVSLDVFEQLCRFSFVLRTDYGWRLHDLMREYIGALLMERQPKRYWRLLERSATYYANEIYANVGKKEMNREVGELFRYMGVKVHRALTTERHDELYYSEIVTHSSLQEAIAYSMWREENAEAISGIEIDPVTGEAFRIQFTTEQVRFNASPIDLEALFHLEPSSIRIIRDQEDRIQAMAVIIPFHQGTLPWLERDPLCGPYVNSLTALERLRLATPTEQPSGWFLRSFDFSDLMNPALRTTGLYVLYSLICRGGLMVCTTYDNEIARRTFTGLGLNVVEGTLHLNHDGHHPTLTYELDTRGVGLEVFIRRLFKNAGLEWRPPDAATGAGSEPSINPVLMDLLTQREQDVAREVVMGRSNAEIARNLILSESTVKKHLKSIYVKLDVNKRTQLTLKLLNK